MFLSSPVMTFYVFCPRRSLFGDGCGDASLHSFPPGTCPGPSKTHRFHAGLRPLAVPGFAASSGHLPGCLPGAEPFSQRCVFAQRWGPVPGPGLSLPPSPLLFWNWCHPWRRLRGIDRDHMGVSEKSQRFPGAMCDRARLPARGGPILEALMV